MQMCSSVDAFAGRHSQPTEMEQLGPVPVLLPDVRVQVEAQVKDAIAEEAQPIVDHEIK